MRGELQLVQVVDEHVVGGLELIIAEVPLGRPRELSVAQRAALRHPGAEHVVVLLADHLRTRAAAHDRVDRQAGRIAEEVEPQRGGVPEARDEPEAEEIEQCEHELGRAVRVGGVVGDR